jgi:lysozyme
MRRRPAVALVAATVFLAAAAQTTPTQASEIKGFDVSHWQTGIRWHNVKDAGFKFVIAKATDGRSFNDPMYTRHRRGASLVGIKFTAYHFARPDGSYRDAIREADHFVNVARLHRGNLIPVLDLERTGGLSQYRLKRWVMTWLLRVERRTGVRPMIYVSPSFWRSRLGNTAWFARNRYRLWIAHYGVSSPSVPAQNWANHGRTMWQWTNTGRVSGVPGRVDRNLLHSPSLLYITIR